MRYGNTMQFINWRVDPDGFLRVTARVLKEGVFPYALSEFSEELQKTYHPDKKVLNVYIPAVEFNRDALITLEGKPVIIVDHVFRDIDNTLKDGFTVGNAAGAPSVEDESILIDLLITDADTADKIKRKELVEVSAGYDGEFVVEQGMFNETPYDGKQVNLRFNHILLLPVGEGRCGYEVRIINKKHKEIESMFEIKVGNRVYRFENEKDAEEAKKMAADEAADASGGFNLDEVRNAMEELPKLREACTKHEGTIANMQAEFDKLKSPEEMEKAAAELLETAEGCEAVMETEVDEKDRETVANAMKGCGNSVARVRELMKHVGNKRGVDVGNMSDSEVKTLFTFTAANSKKLLEAAAKEQGRFVPGGREIFGNNGGNTKRGIHPLFAGMKSGNQKK